MASDLPVDLLEDIFLRLDDEADLARASAVCTSFRRAASGGRFLRRFGSLHRRPLLGLLADKRRHFETEIFFPVQPPWRSASAAAGFVKAADITFSFLPEPKRWRVCDACDGRVLLTRNTSRHRTLLELEDDLVVYDPLHQRHVQIPAIPGDLMLQSDKQDGINEAMAFSDPLLAPAADEDEMDDDEGFRFRVMFTALSKSKVVAFVFSSASGQWRHGASVHNLRHVWSHLPSRWYVHGCICWVDNFDDVMVVFDTREMKLSITDLPDKSICTTMMAVEAGDGRLGLLLLGSNRFMKKIDLYSKALQGIKEPDEWRHDGSIPLIPGYGSIPLIPSFEWFLAGAAEGYVLLQGVSRHDACEERSEVHYFTLDLNTLLFEKLCVLEYDERRRGFLYASFPPPLSPPSICNSNNLSFSLAVPTTEICEYIDLADLFY